MKDGYLRLVARLPRPTSEQGEAFVAFVAGAHSWYKHLPAFPPGAPFTFHLDPNAGRALLHTPTGESAFVDRIDPREQFHYTWMLTTEYRRRFGHWEYATDHGPGLFVGSERRGWVDLRPRARILDDEGSWIDLPAPLADAGTCHLTALVHERLPPHILFDDRRREAMEDFARLAKRSPEDPDVRRYLPFLRLAEEFRDSRPEESEEWARRFEEFCVAERRRQRDLMREAIRCALAGLAGSPL